jgi:four helix bundle protein
LFGLKIGGNRLGYSAGEDRASSCELGARERFLVRRVDVGLRRAVPQTARMRDFKRIKAWQRAHTLTIAIEKLTRGFTRRGHAALRSQLNRSAGSIAANIVEGCNASTNKEFARYLTISINSANETEYHLLSSRDFSLVPLDDWQKYSAETIAVRKMVYAYRKKVLESDKATDARENADDDTGSAEDSTIG